MGEKFIHNLFLNRINHNEKIVLDEGELQFIISDTWTDVSFFTPALTIIYERIFSTFFYFSSSALWSAVSVISVEWVWPVGSRWMDGQIIRCKLDNVYFYSLHKCYIQTIFYISYDFLMFFACTLFFKLFYHQYLFSSLYSVILYRNIGMKSTITWCT